MVAKTKAGKSANISVMKSGKGTERILIMIEIVESSNNEYVSVSKENGLTNVHVGYSEAEFTNKQLDEFIKILKKVKVYG